MSTSTGDITVVIPCLNAEATLAAAIRSVLAQTRPPIEILLIDDHSTDRSVEIARSFGSIVRVLDNPGHGTGPARQLGVCEARGTYIAYVDADDLIEPSKHEKQLAVFAEKGPYTVVHTGSILFYDEPGQPSRLRPSGAAATGRCTRVIFESNPVCGATCMLARSTVLEVGNYDPELWGTDDFGMSLAASTCCEFVYLPEPLYRVRLSGPRMSKRRLRMIYNHWLTQEHFRLRFPEAFAALPAESIRRCMVEPVLQCVREAYWQRDGDGYGQLLKLAHELAPEDADIAKFWRRRWCPLSVLKRFDRVVQQARLKPAVGEEVSMACPPPPEGGGKSWSAEADPGAIGVG